MSDSVFYHEHKRVLSVVGCRDIGKAAFEAYLLVTDDPTVGAVVFDFNDTVVTIRKKYTLVQP